MDLSKYPAMQKALEMAQPILVDNPNLEKFPHLQTALNIKPMSKSLEFKKSGKAIIEAIHIKIGQCQMELIQLEAEVKVKAAEAIAENSKYTDKMETVGSPVAETSTEPEVPWKVRNKLRKIESLRRVVRNIDPKTMYKLSEHDLREYGL